MEIVIGNRSMVALIHNGKLMGLELPYMRLEKVALYESGVKSHIGRQVWHIGETTYFSDAYGEQFVFNDANKAFENIEWKREVNGAVENWNTLMGMYVWSDGTNVYYSGGRNNSEGIDHQYVLDRETNTWRPKDWGLSGVTLNALEIWTDGVDIYYSERNTQLVFNRATSSWSTKTWNNQPSNFEGGDVWTDGEDIYCGADYVLDRNTSTWIAKVWTNAPSSLVGGSVWSDGEHTYYSFDSDQYVLDKANSTWLEKTWNGITSFYGKDVFSANGVIYWVDGKEFYTLDPSTSTWSSYGIRTEVNDLWGGKYHTWSDGNTVYHSYGSAQYVFAPENRTWYAKDWGLTTSLDAQDIWEDGGNIYYNAHAINPSRYYSLMLNKSTNTWVDKSWYGLTNFDARNGIWHDGDNTYYSNGSSHYVLNRNLSRWTAKTWYGNTVFSGDYVWHSGNNTYWSYGSSHYVLDRTTSTWNQKTWNGLSEIDPHYITHIGDKVFYLNGALRYVLDDATSTWTPIHVSPSEDLYGNDVFFDGVSNYYSMDMKTSYKVIGH